MTAIVPVAPLTLARRRLRALPLAIRFVIVILAIFVIVAILAPWVATADPDRQSLLLRLRPPGTHASNGSLYLLGTDDLGRDLFSRLVFGARVSLSVAILSVSLSTIVGVTIGMVAAWFRGWIKKYFSMRLVDIILSIPTVLLAVLTVAVLGPSFFKLILVLGLTRWPRYARVAYAQTLQVANLPYIKAAELAGAGSARTLVRHILPNIAGPILIVATSEFELMILLEAGLSFLGLGIQPPTSSWGTMLSAGRSYVERAWWMVVFPGAALFLLVFSVNVLGDWLRDRLDPYSQIR